MAIEHRTNNMLPLLDGFWMNDNTLLRAEFTRHAEGKRSIALSAPVPYGSLPRPKLIPVYAAAHIAVPAFDGTLLFGGLEDNGRYYAFFLLIAGNQALVTANFTELPPFAHAEVHGTHILLRAMNEETLRVILSEDAASLTAEIL